MPIGKIELINFLHSMGIEDCSEALKLKSVNVSDIKILAHYKILPKSYHAWKKQYSSIVGKSVMNRKRGKLVTMICHECGGVVRWDVKRDRICDKCGLVVDNATQRQERIRFALRELGVKMTKDKLQKIKHFVEYGRDDEDIIQLVASF